MYTFLNVWLHAILFKETLGIVVAFPCQTTSRPFLQPRRWSSYSAIIIDSNQFPHMFKTTKYSHYNKNKYHILSRITERTGQHSTFFDDFEAAEGESFSFSSLSSSDSVKQTEDVLQGVSGRSGIEIALFDILLEDGNISNDNDVEKTMMIQPLPSDHLPTELTTLNVYGMQLTRPIHQMILNHQPLDNFVLPTTATSIKQQFGHVAYKPNANTYVGSIGCAATVLLKANPKDMIGIPDDVLSTADSQFAIDAKQQVSTIFCRGTFRFIVREVKQTIPYTVAIVDELLDDPLPLEGGDQSIVNVWSSDDHDNDDEEDNGGDNAYSTLTRSELLQRLLQGMKTFVDMQLEKYNNENRSPLEQSLIQDVTGVNTMMFAQREATEEMAAVFEIFSTSALIDDFITTQSRYYAVAFMAAEIADFSNELRQMILQTTDSVQRLRFVLKEFESIVSTKRARKLAESVVQTTNEATADLQVGVPTLPQWAKQIQKGIVVDYYWNEEFGWCTCTVIDHPKFVRDDELIVTVHFDDDDTIHKLPFRADEKARWRPKL
jgi:hypothetical protein